jgi:hypothetical protein
MPGGFTSTPHPYPPPGLWSVKRSNSPVPSHLPYFSEINLISKKAKKDQTKKLTDVLGFQMFTYGECLTGLSQLID